MNLNFEGILVGSADDYWRVPSLGYLVRVLFYTSDLAGVSGGGSYFLDRGFIHAGIALHLSRLGRCGLPLEYTGAEGTVSERGTGLVS